MGYTHYWRRPEDLPRPAFVEFRRDVDKILAAAVGLGLKIGDGHGRGVPDLTDDYVSFNGLVACGHKENPSITIPWPAPGASGIASDADEVQEGHWFAGALLRARVCDGDCSYETFRIDQHEDKPDYAKDEPLVFAFCKTAFRPYDVAVTAALIAAKHHFGDAIRVSSDGEDENWQDGRILCHVACGYGQQYHLRAAHHGDGEELADAPASVKAEV